METQMRFRFIDATAQKDGSVEQVNYYLECSWELNNTIEVIICTIPHHNLKLTKETASQFKEAFTFSFKFEDANVSNTRTVYFQIGNTDEIDEAEVFVDHECEGFKYCENEMQNYIIKNQSLWKAVEQ